MAEIAGRCRTCRLPISVQYPLVELTVGLVFLFVYVTEISSAGQNLPGLKASQLGGGGLLGTHFTTQLMIRSLTYLFALCGLMAAGLIAVRRQPVPLRLFAWSLVPWLVATQIRPEWIIQRWREGQVAAGGLAARLDALVSIVCGMAAGMAVARLLAPILYVQFDRTLISGDLRTRQARQYLCGMAVAGAIVGWQAVLPLAWVSFLAACLAIACLRRFRQTAELGDMLVWLWLGLMLFRANGAGWLSSSPCSQLHPADWPCW